MMKNELCSAFCENIAVREVPIGYAIKSPFRRADGDALAIYARRSENNPKEYRLEDDGETIAFLESSGVDLDSEARFEALTGLLKEHDAFLSESESVIHTRFAVEDKIPSMTVLFSGLLLRIYDLLLLTAYRVRGTFRDDLVKLVESQFGDGAKIDVNEPLQTSMKDYIVDIVVRSNDGRALAIYACTSELKALEALLFSKEQREQRITNVRAMLVLETSKPRDIKERTLSRVMNSNILLASMDGDEISIRQKMSENLIA
jgi:hypothetical protein